MGDGSGAAGRDAPSAEEIARAGLRAKRWVLAVVIVVSLWVIASSSLQIIPQVFGLGVSPIGAPSAAASPERACAVGIRGLLGALDRAGGQLPRAATTSDDTEAMAALRASLSPEWDSADSVARTCAGSRDGQDAWAALERMRVAEEQIVRLGRVGLVPLRLDVATHLPPDLR
jgi:hypothetical protein